MTSDASGLMWCRDDRRRGDVVNHPGAINGLDFVEYFENAAALPGEEYRIEATFLKPPPAALVGSTASFAVVGGARILGIRVLGVQAHPLEPLRLNIFVDQPGDFSTYLLTVDHADIDPQLAAAPFSFKASCPTDFDCRSDVECPPEVPAEPLLDYLAKDYQSFRRLLLDLIPQRNPRWLERNPADLGMALVELFAYAGDHLSYFQDAVATEAYLDTCRQRISAKRHARLIDYRVHDGRNAWTHVHFEVESAGVVPQGTTLLTRVPRALRGQPAAPGTVIPPGQLDFEADPALHGVEVFETAARIAVDPDHNELRFHTWGNADCCLARGTTEAWLYGLPATGGASRDAYRPQLAVGDYLLIEEVKGAITGLSADADARHRQVVRLVAVEDAEDPVYSITLTDGRLNLLAAAGDPVLLLQRVEWRDEDALTFPACLSAETPETGPIDNITIARGNVAPCDHGRTLIQPLPPPVATGGPGSVSELALPEGPLTLQGAPSDPTFANDGRMIEGRHELDVDVRAVVPAAVLILAFPPAEIEIWTPVPDLLDSGAFDRHFVVDIDNDGRAMLRFGDDAYGRRPLGANAVTARYRIGNGRAGNLGYGSLVHVATPSAAELTDPADPAAPPAAFPAVHVVWQAIAARAGREPETIEEVRQLAPRAFHVEQFRAVTEADYEQAALKLEELAAAKATFRWTGSWHTVFLAAHPVSREDLTGDGKALVDDLRDKLVAHLTGYKLAGYDLEVRAAQYVPLEIEIELCVARGHFRGDVLEAVAKALGTGSAPDGSVGFFALANFTFGQPVYLSRLYAAVEAVEGVDSAIVRVFKRYWESANDEIEKGLIPMSAFEIPRLDNDPNFRENGVLRLEAVGGL